MFKMKNYLVRWQYVKRQAYETLSFGETEQQAKEKFLSGFTENERKHVEIDRIDLDTPKIKVESETDAGA
jgi:hypothetical protein